MGALVWSHCALTSQAEASTAVWEWPKQTRLHKPFLGTFLFYGKINSGLKWQYFQGRLTLGISGNTDNLLLTRLPAESIYTHLMLLSFQGLSRWQPYHTLLWATEQNSLLSLSKCINDLPGEQCPKPSWVTLCIQPAFWNTSRGRYEMSLQAVTVQLSPPRTMECNQRRRGRGRWREKRF